MTTEKSRPYGPDREHNKKKFPHKQDAHRAVADPDEPVNSEAADRQTVRRKDDVGFDPGKALD